MRLYVFLVFAVCSCFAGDSLTDNFKIASHTVTLNGKKIKYSTTVGTLPIKNSCKGTSANIFFMSYTMDSENEVNRPVTFLFNGGPGSASVFLHLSAFGPKKIDLENNDSSSYRFVENDESLLEHSDLVFIDPVGTGFSDLSTENINDFFSVGEDARAVGDFICKYLTTFDKWLSNKYIIGESYGAIRAVLVAEYLQDSFGVYLDGVSLISPVINASHLMMEAKEHLPYALIMPSYCAAAWYHGALPSDLQEKDLFELISEVKSFAFCEYVIALIKGDTLSFSEREKTINILSRYTGISKEIIDKCNLRIDLDTFISHLLPKDSATDLDFIVGVHDATCVGYSKAAGSHCENPGLNNFLGSYSSVANDYIRKELGYFCEEPYLLFNNEANVNWKWEKNYQKDFKNLDTSDDIRHLLMVNPRLKFFVASGCYDLVTPFSVTEFDVNHLHLPSKLNQRIQFKTYEGGHMMYLNKNTHEKLTRDLISSFYN